MSDGNRRSGLTPRVRTRRIHALYGPTSRGLNILVSLLALVALLPLLVGIAVAIKATSRGPILFRQARYGRDGALFTIFKFRTMFIETCDATGVAQTVQDDPRVTPVGRFLRQTSFDELPQLLNILRGDMALVGPRPHVPGMLVDGIDYEDFDARYRQRFEVLPGLTGLAQVNGCRGETICRQRARKRLDFDLEYIRNRSLLLDAAIVLKTIKVEFITGSGS